MAGASVVLVGLITASAEPFHVLLSLNPWSPVRTAESFRTGEKLPSLRGYRSPVCSINETFGCDR
jgi:hypothetical protein